MHSATQRQAVRVYGHAHHQPRLRLALHHRESQPRNALVVVPTRPAPLPLPLVSTSAFRPAVPASARQCWWRRPRKSPEPIVSTQLWVDGVKNYNAPGSTTLTTSVSLAAGTHRFAVIATNTAGQKWESAVNATVK